VSLKQDYKYIKFEQPSDGLTAITLNRPDKRNALHEPMAKELEIALKSLELDPAAKVVVLKGEGPSFCSGWDLDSQKAEARETLTDASKQMFQELETQFYGTLANVQRILWESPVVSIAQVQGYAIESGMSLALNCDLVIAAEDAKFLWRPVGGAGMLWHLWPWTIGLRKTKELLFEGNFVTGPEAEQLGMINKCVPLEDLNGEVQRRATRISQKPREFLYLDKVSINNAFEAMGMRLACNTSALSHVLSHLTVPSAGLRDRLAKGTKEEVREILDQRASPFTREPPRPKKTGEAEDG
jgi:enoyl-CoA hydratase